MTSWQPCWWSKTKIFLSSGNLTQFSCTLSEKKNAALTTNMAAMSRGIQTKTKTKSYPCCLAVIPTTHYHSSRHTSRASANNTIKMADNISVVDALSSDIKRPLDLEKCSRGWETQREHCYWVPTADIIGEVPKDLRGTLFRNGPGVHEVYGTRLKHREYKTFIFWR